MELVCLVSAEFRTRSILNNCVGSMGGVIVTKVHAGSTSSGLAQQSGELEDMQNTLEALRAVQVQVSNIGDGSGTWPVG